MTTTAVYTDDLTLQIGDTILANGAAVVIVDASPNGGGQIVYLAPPVELDAKRLVVLERNK